MKSNLSFYEKKLTPKEAFKKARKFFKTQKEFAKKCGVCQQTISKWSRFGVPVKKAPIIEKSVKGLVKRHELRPDFFNIE